MNRAAMLAVMVALAGCSSVSSLHSPTQANADGLTYFMPRRDFIVKVTVVDGGKLSNVAFDTTASYPDPARQYILTHGANVFGKNTLDVAISGAGLLTSAKSTTESKVTDAFKNLGTLAGTVSAMGGGDAAPSQKLGGACSIAGTHVFVLDKPGRYDVCGLQVDLAKKPTVSGMPSALAKAADQHESGLYYRQQEPYLIQVQGAGINSAAVLMAPNESPVRFLPVSKTFFSGNSADFAFEDGVPTKYKQETEGEIVALLKLPADVLSAYFSAAGAVFDAFKERDQKEAAALAESLKLEVARKKYEACIVALKAAGKDGGALFKELKCDDTAS